MVEKEKDIVERLRKLSSPLMEGMPDGLRMTAFVHAGLEAAEEIERLRARLFPSDGGPPADQERDFLAEQCSELLRENERLRSELKGEIDHRYHGLTDHPAMKRRYERDLKDALGQAGGQTVGSIDKSLLEWAGKRHSFE